MSKKRKEKANQSLENRAERKIVMDPAPKFEQPIEKPRAIGNDNMREALPEMTIPTAPNRVQSTTTATTDMPKDLGMKMNVGLAKGPEIKANAQVANPTTIAEAGKYTPEKKPLTFEEMLAEQRKKAVQEKTDALKMQKYHALNDVFNALGKMGGTAIGSAVGGGKVFDNATPVGEYQQSRNYINAFEKAKEANERLRKLDDTEFQLAYSKAQRDEERAYQAAEKKAEREYRAQLDALDKQWQKDMLDYRAKIDAALAANNMELKAQYEAEQAAKEQEYWKERQAITHKGEMDIKNLSKEIVAMQMGGGVDSNDIAKTGIPVYFNNDTLAVLDKDDIRALQSRYMNKQVGNEFVDENNFMGFLSDNPDLVTRYLVLAGKAQQPTPAVSAKQTGEAGSYEVGSATNSDHTALTPVQRIAVSNELPPSVLRMQERNNKAAQKQAKKKAEEEAKIAASRENIESLNNGAPVIINPESAALSMDNISTEDYNARFKRK